jgi:hypothetical protein
MKIRRQAQPGADPACHGLRATRYSWDNDRGSEAEMKRKNVTVALEESVARWARVEAARRDTSLSEFLSSMLRERMREDRRYERLMIEYLAVQPALLKREDGYPTRESLHERIDLR